MKARLVIPVIMVLTLLLGACSSGARAPEKLEAPAAVEMQQPVAVQVEGESAVEAPAVQAPALMATAAPAAAPKPQEAGLPQNLSQPSARMIIKDGLMELLVQDTDVALERVTQLAADQGGYLISSRIWMEDGYKNAELRMGVPSMTFEDTMNRLRRIGGRGAGRSGVGAAIPSIVPVFATHGKLGLALGTQCRCFEDWGVLRPRTSHCPAALATTATATAVAPARLSVPAASLHVAPVVSTSSTNKTRAPRTASGRGARKAPRTLRNLERYRQIQKKLMAARLIRQDPRLRAVVLTYFACGPDSFGNPFFKDEIGEPCYVMQIDEHTADAGVITRLEAFADTACKGVAKTLSTTTMAPAACAS